MPEKFKCTCGCGFFTKEVYQLDTRGRVLITHSHWYKCGGCPKVYYVKNEKVREAEE